MARRRMPLLSLLALFSTLPVGCDREKRQLHSSESMSATPNSTQLISLVPGLPPSTEPAATALDQIDPIEFERNAFNLSEGQRLFTQMNCGTCHAAGGGGDIGPTLVDDTWIYGHEPRQIFSTIVEGRPNGMPAYGTKLSQTQAWQLTAYVRSLGGLIPKSIAPSRQDAMQTSPPPNSNDKPAELRTAPPASAVKSEGSR